MWVSESKYFSQPASLETQRAQRKNISFFAERAEKERVYTRIEKNSKAEYLKACENIELASRRKAVYYGFRSSQRKTI